MVTKRNVYLLFTCDAWKSNSSNRLVGIFLNFKRTKAAIRSLVKNKVVELEEGYSIKDISDWTVAEINNNIKYLYLYEGYNGEFQSNGGVLV
jgi:hypothetical protein